MIRSMGNVEYFGMCEISPKIQCPHCLTHWTKGVENSCCGTCFRPTDKTCKLNRDRLDASSIPNYVIKKGPSHGARHGNTERQPTYHAAHVAAKKENKRDITICWHDFKIVQLTEHHRSRLDGTKNSAHSTTQLQKKTIRIWLQHKSRKDMKMDGYRYSTAKGETVRWTNMNYKKKLKDRGRRSTPVNKFDNEQISRSLGTAKDLNELTQRLAGSGTLRIHHQAHLHRGGDHQTNGGMHGVGLNSDFFIFSKAPSARCFAYRQWRFPCKRRSV